MNAWWFAPVPRARLAVLRAVVYVFTWVDVLVFTRGAFAHLHAPAEFYRPVLLARLLGLPAPTPALGYALLAVIFAGGALAAAGRLPRAAGFAVAGAYLWWALIAMSYGKVDHDHLALIVALFVLPTAGAAGFRDRTEDAAAGWALRCVQVAVVATYFLAAVTKMRMGGWDWASGEILRWALTRRPTPTGELLLGLDMPWLLYAMQWVVLIAEFLSPVALFLRGRALAAVAVFWMGFHLMTYLLLGIHFLPTAICWAAFAPLERLVRPVPALAPAPVQVRGRAPGR